MYIVKFKNVFLSSVKNINKNCCYLQTVFTIQLCLDLKTIFFKKLTLRF